MTYADHLSPLLAPPMISLETLLTLIRLRPNVSTESLVREANDALNETIANASAYPDHYRMLAARVFEIPIAPWLALTHLADLLLDAERQEIEGKGPWASA